MRTGRTIIVFAVLWLSGQSAHAGPWAREHVIDEPVFDGQAVIYEAGIGNSRSIVLVHGIGDEAAAIWESLVPALARDFHVVTFDLPGFGRSSKANALYSPANYVTFVKHVVDQYVHRPFVLMGHSMGGAISLRYTATYPQDVMRLVVVDAPGILYRMAYGQYLTHFGIDSLPVFYPGQKDDLGGLATRVMRRFENMPVDPEVLVASASARQSALGGDPKKIAGLALAVDDFSKIVTHINAPTLVIWGDSDPVAPLRTGRLLETVLPSSQLTVIKAGHVPMTDNPAAFNEAIQDFVRSDAPLPTKPPHQRAPIKGDREGVCIGKRNKVFEGEYASLEISHCEGVEIRNARIGMLRITSSSVTIENSDIGDGDSNLRVHRSRVTMTGGSIEAKTAVVARGSDLDLAGVRIVGDEKAFLATQRSSVVFSICEVKSPYTSGYMHGHQNVLPRKPL